MGLQSELLPDHEGYAARRLPDGTLTGMWTPETRAFSAYVASCDCGWTGGSYPATDAGEEAACEEWVTAHKRALVTARRHALPRQLSMLLRNLADRVEHASCAADCTRVQRDMERIEEVVDDLARLMEELP